MLHLFYWQNVLYLITTSVSQDVFYVISIKRVLVQKKSSTRQIISYVFVVVLQQIITLLFKQLRCMKCYSEFEVFFILSHHPMWKDHTKHWLVNVFQHCWDTAVTRKTCCLLMWRILISTTFCLSRSAIFFCMIL